MVWLPWRVGVRIMLGAAGKIITASKGVPQTAFEKTITQGVGGLGSTGYTSSFVSGVGAAIGSIDDGNFIGGTIKGLFFFPGEGITDEWYFGMEGTTWLQDDFTSVEILGAGGFTLLTANVDDTLGFETINGGKFWKWGDDDSYPHPSAWNGSGDVDVILHI